VRFFDKSTNFGTELEQYIINKFRCGAIGQLPPGGRGSHFPKWVDGTDLRWLVRGWRREAGSWFQRRGEAYWKERSVIRKEVDANERASVTKDEERVLRGGWTVMRLCRYEGWVVVSYWLPDIGGKLTAYWLFELRCPQLQDNYLFIYYAGRQHNTTSPLQRQKKNRRN